MNLKTIDLCAGIGGIRRGFELAGDYRNIASAEIDEMACKTYVRSISESVAKGQFFRLLSDHSQLTCHSAVLKPDYKEN